MRIACDIETDSLTPTKIWCISCIDMDTGDLFTFDILDDPNWERFSEFAKDVDLWVGHNFLGFDAYAINRLTPVTIPSTKIEDTMVLSYLGNPNRFGKFGHSLKMWGNRLGFTKGSHDVWDEYSPEMLEYCIKDTRLTILVYEALEKEMKSFSNFSKKLEHTVAMHIRKMEKNGVAFDMKRAQKLYAEVCEVSQKLEERIKDKFGKFASVIKEVEPRYNKDGSLSKRGRSKLPEDLKKVEGPFTYIEFKEFNLDSPKQLVSKLNKVGWQPWIKTDAHKAAEKEYEMGRITAEDFADLREFGWKICEENLDTLPEDAPEEYHLLAKWKMVVNRARMLEKQYFPNVRDGRIYGRIIPNGAVTGRMTHNGPNLANISSVAYYKEGPNKGQPIKGIDGKYGYEMRQLFTIEGEDRVMVGADAEQLELRALGHDMKDEAFINELVEGDAHEANRLILGIPSRDVAKTFIFALIYGAGAEKLGRILGGNFHTGKTMKAKFLKGLPQLRELIRDLSDAAEKCGKIRGLDGRLLHIRKTYAALNTRIQSSGAIICKVWLCNIMKEVYKKGLDVKLVLAVHDEYQFDAAQKDVEDLKVIIQEAIEKVQSQLNLRLPMDSNVSVGGNWAETH